MLRLLKLWFVLRYFGRNGLVANLRESLRMAACLGDTIAGDTRLELAAPVTMGLVCFRVRRGDSATRELMRRINGSRDFFVSHTALDGKVVMRVAVGNIRTRQQVPLGSAGAGQPHGRARCRHQSGRRRRGAGSMVANISWGLVARRANRLTTVSTLQRNRRVKPMHLVIVGSSSV
jgi:hypothetical protein